MLSKARWKSGAGPIRLNSEVVAIHNGGGKYIHSVEVVCNGQKEVIHGSDFISSMPVTEFIKKLDPPAPPRGFAGG